MQYKCADLLFVAAFHVCHGAVGVETITLRLPLDGFPCLAQRSCFCWEGTFCQCDGEIDHSTTGTELMVAPSYSSNESGMWRKGPFPSQTGLLGDT